MEFFLRELFICTGLADDDAGAPGGALGRALRTVWLYYPLSAH